VGEGEASVLVTSGVKKVRGDQHLFVVALEVALMADEALAPATSEVTITKSGRPFVAAVAEVEPTAGEE
jgi:hypothetical protein